jgi:O-antigen ligase
MRGGVAEFAHNDFFQIAAEQGFIGLALFLGAMVAMLAGPRALDPQPITRGIG